MIWPTLLWIALGVWCLYVCIPSARKAHGTWRFWRHYRGNGRRAARVAEARADFRRHAWRLAAAVGIIVSGVLGGMEQVGWLSGWGMVTLFFLMLLPSQLAVNSTLDWYADKAVVSKLPKEDKEQTKT